MTYVVNNPAMFYIERQESDQLRATSRDEQMCLSAEKLWIGE
jgi:hypothetical protein